MGPIVIGVIAVLVAWATALHETTPPAQIGGCLLAGVGGANYLTSRLRAQNYRSAAQQSAAAASSSANVVAARALTEPRDPVETADTDAERDDGDDQG